MRSLFGNDWNWIVAGLVAALLVPGLTIYAGLPLWVAGVIALFVFGGLVLVLTPRQLFEGIDVKAIGTGQVAFARDLLAEAMPAAERLREAAPTIADKDIAKRIKHLADICADVFKRIEASPASAPTVRRFLSYYIPRAAELAEGFATLETKRAQDPARLENLRAVILKLEEAFVHYADSLVDNDLGTLDTDLRLVQASLKEDLGH